MTFKKLKSNICNMLRMRRAIKYAKKNGIVTDAEGDSVFCIIHLYENGKPTSCYSETIEVPIKKREPLFSEGYVYDEDLYKIKVIGYNE